MSEDLANIELRDRIARLLNRYPRLQPAETGELLEFLKSGPAIDRGILKGDPAFASAIERVQTDHADHFRLSIGKQLLVSAMIALPFVALCWLIADRGL